jgi:hypothetical protein
MADKVYTEEEIKEIRAEIDNMSQLEMARLYRFAPAGHIYFNSTLPFFDYFNKRFKDLGGMTPGISKQIGWD